MPEEQNRISLSKEQKIGFVLLCIFAVLAVGLGVLQIRNTMYAPFALNKKIPPLDATAVNNVDALRYRDTDHDGLNDFDELYVYHTSPYLADTNSDGINDKDSIDKGINPVCPNGQDCSFFESGNIATSTPAVNSVEPSVQTGVPSDLQNIVSDPTALRQLLLSAGMDKKVLDATTDADLLKMAKDVLSSTTTVSNLQSLQTSTVQ